MCRCVLCVSVFFLSIHLEYCNQLCAPGVLLLWLEMLQAIAVDIFVCHRCDVLHKVFPGAPKGSEAPQALITWLLMARAQLCRSSNSIRLEHFEYFRIECEVAEMEDQDKESLHATHRFNTCSHTRFAKFGWISWRDIFQTFSTQYTQLPLKSSNCTSSLKKSGYLAPSSQCKRLNRSDWFSWLDLWSIVSIVSPKSFIFRTWQTGPVVSWGQTDCLCKTFAAKPNAATQICMLANSDGTPKTEAMRACFKSLW